MIQGQSRPHRRPVDRMECQGSKVSCCNSCLCGQGHRHWAWRALSTRRHQCGHGVPNEWGQPWGRADRGSQVGKPRSERPELPPRDHTVSLVTAHRLPMFPVAPAKFPRTGVSLGSSPFSVLHQWLDAFPRRGQAFQVLAGKGDGPGGMSAPP